MIFHCNRAWLTEFKRLTALEKRMYRSILALQGVLQAATMKPTRVVDIARDGMASDGVCIWPWRVDEERNFQRVGTDLHQAKDLPGFKLSCLVFAPDLEVLQAVRVAVIRSPVIVSDDRRVMIHSEPLDSSLLLSLFLAAKMQPCPCLSLVLSVSAA